MSRRLFNHIALVAGSQIIGQAANFARNVILARLLGPAEMGAAAMLAAAVSLLEMLTDVVAEEALITDGRDDPRLQSTIHGLRLVRGFAAAALFAAASPWLLPALDLAAHPLPIAVGAVLLITRGLTHSDLDRFVRDRKYLAYAAMQALPPVVALAAAWPAALLASSYVAVTVLLVVHSAACVVLSHAVAGRRYAARIFRPQAAAILRFGLPILANGMLLLVIFQGERVVIAHAFGPAATGVYVAAMGLALVPALLAARVNAAILLPRLARRPDADARASATLGLIAVVAAAGFALAGPTAMAVYGPSFQSGTAIIGALGIAQVLFVLRDTQNISAMARGDTAHPIFGNLVRVAGVGGSAVLAGASASLAVIAWWVVAVEFIAAVVGAIRLSRRHHIPALQSAAPAVWALAAGVGCALAMQPGLSLPGASLALAALLAAVRANLAFATPAPAPTPAGAPT